MGQALPKPALRPYLRRTRRYWRRSSSEHRGVDRRGLLRGAAGGLGSRADDEEQFGKRLASELTLIATLQNSPVGFASLKGADHIEMLYVHPSAAGQGVATMLCDALEKLAGARGAKILTVDASDNAQEFFRKRGYVDKQRNTVTVNGEWLANTRCRRRWRERPAPGGPS